MSFSAISTSCLLGAFFGLSMSRSAGVTSWSAKRIVLIRSTPSHERRATSCSRLRSTTRPMPTRPVFSSAAASVA